MKSTLFSLLILIGSRSMAQTDSLQSGVHRWENSKVEKTQRGERRQLLKGSTLDLKEFGIHASTLAAGQTNHPLQLLKEVEELIIVKEGNLKIITKDTAKVLGPGGIALLVAGEEQSFQNSSDKPATYYVLSYKAKKPVNIQRGREGGSSFIKDWGELVVKKTEKGESRPIFDRPSSMFERFEMHATSLNPGLASHDPHTHRPEELILLLKGEVQMQLAQSFVNAREGDIIIVASNVLHGIKNIGNVQCAYFAIQWNN